MDTPLPPEPEETNHHPSAGAAMPAPVSVQNLSRESAAPSIHIPRAPEEQRSVNPAVPVVVAVQREPTDQVPYRAGVHEENRVGVTHRFIAAWRKIGGGSLMMSLLIHAGLLLGAFLAVQTIVHEKKVDFLPGGSSKPSGDATPQIQQKVQAHNLSKLTQASPQQRVVIEGPAAIALPEQSMDVLDIPSSAPSLMGGGSMGGMGATGSGGLGIGSGQGLGSGKLNGFLATTFFGKLGGDGLPGTFYDLKQTQDKQAIEYDQNRYAAIIKAAADDKFSPKSLEAYYRASQQMSFTFLAIPYMSANEGPKAFNVDKEVQPRGWFVHYTGYITPPKTGEWRFLGNFDDALVVYINNKPVLDASWLNIANFNEKQPDPEIKQNFGGPPVLTPKTHVYAGKWVRMNGPVKIDIIVGERPGGYVGGLLLVQHRKTTYKERPDGTPILPVFTTTKPEMDDIERMKKFTATNPPFDLEINEIPVFEVKTSKLDIDARSSLLPPR